MFDAEGEVGFSWNGKPILTIKELMELMRASDPNEVEMMICEFNRMGRAQGKWARRIALRLFDDAHIFSWGETYGS